MNKLLNCFRLAKREELVTSFDNTISKPATVIKITDDDKLVLNVGNNKNIKIGFVFNIYRLGDEMFDPETKLSLGILELTQAVGVVEDVQENMCILRPAFKTTEFILSDIPNDYFPFLRTNKQILTTKEPTNFKNVKVGDLAKSPDLSFVNLLYEKK